MFQIHNYQNFLFYGSFLKTIEAIPDEALRYKVLMAIIRYGCNDEEPNPTEEPLVYAFLQLAIPNIDTQKKNYERKGGGRPQVSPSQGQFNELFETGILTNQEIADKLNVSLSTVDRRKRLWREDKEAISEAESAENVTHMNIFFGKAGGE